MELIYLYNFRVMGDLNLGYKKVYLWWYERLIYYYNV